MGKSCIGGRRFGILLGLTLAGAISGCAGPAPQAIARPHTNAEIENCPAADSVLPAMDSDYGRELVRQIRKLTFYPQSALSFDQSGVVQICVELSRAGGIQKALVRTSSGHLVLDGAALYAVGRAKAGGNLDPVPDELGIGTGNVWFAVPVTFRITGEDAPGMAPAVLTEEQDHACTTFTGQPPPIGPYVQSREFHEYVNRLLDEIQKQVVFPPDAVAQHEEGSAYVCLVLKRDGHILKAKIQRSAGDPLFDGVVLMALGAVDLRAETGPLPSVVPGTLPFLAVALPVNWQFP